ncbi:DUF6247 family protein [Streptomyces sp. NPDC090741]|uniref:DUF6247 family protein n=1 Tax=Streptomyces sp. NPDC090741 TaxID=3365967 RepID=UPI0038022D59
MSTAPESGPEAVPQPAARPEDLRAALARLAPSRLPEFDAERAAAVAQARAEVSPAPLHRLVSYWAVEVAHARNPQRLARLRDLEHRAQSADDADLPGVLSQIRMILLEVHAEAGFTRQGDSR